MLNTGEPRFIQGKAIVPFYVNGQVVHQEAVPYHGNTCRKCKRNIRPDVLPVIEHEEVNANKVNVRGIIILSRKPTKAHREGVPIKSHTFTITLDVRKL